MKYKKYISHYLCIVRYVFEMRQFQLREIRMEGGAEIDSEKRALFPQICSKVQAMREAKPVSDIQRQKLTLRGRGAGRKTGPVLCAAMKKTYAGFWPSPGLLMKRSEIKMWR